MSDFAQGAGWWQASDGKWYAPELHPDAQAAAQQAQPVTATYATAPAYQTEQSVQSAAYAQPSPGQAQQPFQQQQPAQTFQQQPFQQQQPAQTIPYPQPQPAGPGWWQASDGNWYPPELHPDAQVAATASAGWAAPGTQAPFLAGSGWDQGAAGGVGPPAKTKKLKLFRKKK